MHKSLSEYTDEMHRKYNGPVGQGMGANDSHTWRHMTDDEVAEYRKLERWENAKEKGYLAFRNGDDIDDCPFENDREFRAYWWVQGYQEAFDEAKAQMHSTCLNEGHETNQPIITRKSTRRTKRGNVKKREKCLRVLIRKSTNEQSYF